MQRHGGEILFFLILGIFLTGFLGNGFMALVTCIDWIKTKKVSAVDLILVALAISRISLLSIIKLKSLLLTFFLDGLTEKQRILDILWVLSHFSSVWFATSLSIFYFLRIANFSHPFFFWLKWRIKQVVCILLVGPLLMSLSVEFLLLESIYHNRTLSSTENERNESQEVQVNSNQYFIEQIGLNFLNVPPLFLSTISCFLLLLSLWKHAQRMQLKVQTSRDPSSEAHIRAMKATLSFLILLLLYFVGIYITYKNFSTLTSIFGVAVMSLYPSGHTFILILWNSKLRLTAILVCGKIKCYLRGILGR
ncbi:taste receptor type 2 member 7-like [Dromiciops gliroides]|uniref:taste receptor type 2 member 7-like n=1 Tax=Dromiciops gliroides TaxID=33562 RepID=UPI001CC8241F|nr:taste receptor type 2 member 7-like [Dromiciops gliroides]